MVTSTQQGAITQYLDPFITSIDPQGFCGLEMITLHPVLGEIETTDQLTSHTDQLSITLTPSVAIANEMIAVITLVDWPSRVMISDPWYAVVLDCAYDQYAGLAWETGVTDTKVVTV